MIFEFILNKIFQLLNSIIDIFLDPVTSLPLGVDEPMLFLTTRINDLLYYMPWLETIWNVFLIALGIKVALFIFEWILFFIRLARG